MSSRVVCVFVGPLPGGAGERLSLARAQTEKSCVRLLSPEHRSCCVELAAARIGNEFPMSMSM